VTFVVAPKRKWEQGLDRAIERAVDFHGHLGPFLVVGVRMGIVGLKHLKMKQGDTLLRATAFVKPSVPFSCVIDGIQVTTKCTIGNGKLKLKKSPETISAAFEISDGKRVTATLNPACLAELRKSTSTSVASEALEEISRVVASIPEKELFIIQK